MIYVWYRDMVKTRTGKSTTMELSDDFIKYLDSRFEQLLMRIATKDDVIDLKNDVSTLINRVEDQCDKIDLLNSQVAEQGEKIDVLEARVAMLESHVRQLKISHESQEQYSRRLCLRIDRIDLPKNGDHETAEQCLEKVKKVFDEIDVKVPDAVIDRAHRIGPKKTVQGETRQQMIVRFTTWRHRTAVYRARKKAKKVKIRLDLTKRRLDLLILANSILESHNAESYAFADVNCRLRAKIGEKYSFFDSEGELRKLLKEEDDDENDENPVVSEHAEAENPTGSESAEDEDK